MSLQPFFFLGNSLFEPRDKLFFGSFSLILLDHTSSVFDIIRCKFRNFSWNHQEKLPKFTHQPSYIRHQPSSVPDACLACLAINTIQVCLSCQFKQMPLTPGIDMRFYLFAVSVILMPFLKTDKRPYHYWKFFQTNSSMTDLTISSIRHRYNSSFYTFRVPPVKGRL